jgi:hypothetical protein
MKERNELLDNLRQWMRKEDADELINNFAHALAEKQREWLRSHDYGPDDEPCPCEGCSWCLAQDYIGLIDPYRTDL